MKTIRVGVFETNSSSTHSITICLKSDYTKWKKNKNVLIDFEKGKVMTREELIETWKKDKDYANVDWNDKEEVDDIFDELFYDEIMTYKRYQERGLEEFYKEFKAPNGEVIVAFGQYGYEG